MDRTKYTDRPNLLRVATELSKCRDPDGVLEALRSVLKRSVNDPANSNQDLALPVSEIATVLNDSLRD